ncbi:MAG: glutamine amidotransferase [Planctomycetota bacterium]|nr:glutamine amidotransferase [Planctomycetota bacterium]
MMPPPVNVGEHLVLESLVPPLWAAVAVLALAAVVVAVALVRPAAVARGRRATLLVLRLAVVMAAGLLLLGPVIKWQGEERVAGEVALVVDASRSMAIRDVRPAMSRAEAVREAFAHAKKPYGELAAKCEIKPYAFGTHTRATDELSPKPEDPRTDIGEALAFMANPQGGTPSDRLAAVVLISDGRANRARTSAEAAARQLAARGVKVYAVLVGSERPTDRVRDVAVRDLRAPARVHVGNRAEIRAVVATLGMAGKAFEAVLTLDGKEAERRKFTPDANQTTEEITFTPVIADGVGKEGVRSPDSVRLQTPSLPTPALVRVALVVEPLPDELITTNNRAESAISVDEGDVRVLYLDGRIYPEGKFLARAIGEAKGIDLDRRILLGGSPPAASNAAAVVSAPTPEEIENFNVIMIGDLPASAVPAATITRMAERVRAGRLSVLALGGLSAYGAGGWAATPLAGILPFTIRDGDGQTPGPIRFRPAAHAAEHFIFAGDTPAAPLAFDALPPMAGASAVGALLPTARLLAASPEGLPLLAVREFDRGRVAALTVDTTWQWVQAPSETRGAEVHRRFWRQLVLWLAGRDGRPQADLWVMTDRPRYMLSDPDRPPQAEVTAHASGSTSAPETQLIGPDGATRKLQLSADDGDWRAVVPLTNAGTYTLKVIAEAPPSSPDRKVGVTPELPRNPDLTVGARTHEAETKFVVEEQDFETANILADAEGLARIARAGGGVLLPIDRLGDLLTELAGSLTPQVVAVERRLPLGSGRVFLAMVLALLAAEWVLRRRWGLA